MRPMSSFLLALAGVCFGVALLVLAAYFLGWLPA